MACDSWKLQIDRYLDGELPEIELKAFDAHLRGCPSCSADALARVQMKRAVQLAGKRFAPNEEFRRRIQKNLASKPRRSFGWSWVFVTAMALIALGAILISGYVRARSNQRQLFSEIADLHIADLASASPVDVISSDRHTVKPWFQGKISFAFNLPELENSPFTLIGGRITYLRQTPGAHLVYDVRKHHISVFIFPESAVGDVSPGNSLPPTTFPFNMETWTQNGLRYFVIGDAGMADVDTLAKLFQAT
jgi:anti-sigma factor RsiW